MKQPHPFHIHVPTFPVDLWEKLRRLAKANRRTLKEEALVALESHLANNGLLSAEERKKLLS
jgi:hypothetical protein